MHLRHYLLLMSLGTTLCWASLAFIVWNINPFEASLFVIAFFYVSLFLAILGSFSVIGFLIRRAVVKNDDIVFRHVKKTFQRGIVMSAFALATLFLSHAGLLAWWNSVVLCSLLIVVELLVFTNRKFSNQEYVA